MAKKEKKAAVGGNGADTNAKAVLSSGGPRFTLKPSKGTCVILGVLMGAVLAGTGTLIVWQKGEIDAMGTVVQQKQAQVASGERVARRLQEVEATYTDTQSQLRFLETSVTPGEYVPTLLKQMEGLAKSVTLKVAAVRPKLEPAPPPPAKDSPEYKTYKPQPYDRLAVDMEVSGSYWSVAKLLYRLTEFPKIMTVEGVQLAPELPLKATSPNLKVSLKVIGFIFPNDGVPVGGSDFATPVTPGKPNTPAKAAFVSSPAPAVSVRTAVAASPGGGV
jgi:Tfp pilus assembly protein PilO